VHAVEQVLGRGQVPHVHAPMRREVPPGAHRDGDRWHVADQLAGVVAEQHAVAAAVQVGGLLEPLVGDPVGVAGEHAPVRLGEEAEAGAGGGEVHPTVVADVRRSIGVLNDVQVAEASHAEGPRRDRSEVRRTGAGAPGGGEPRQRDRDPEVEAGCDAVLLGRDGAPAPTRVDEHGRLVLAEHERHPPSSPADPSGAEHRGEAAGADLDPDLAGAGVVEGEQVVAVGGGEPGDHGYGGRRVDLGLHGDERRSR
jgi:hypothetical protein